jgi:hypothetical protein
VERERRKDTLLGPTSPSNGDAKHAGGGSSSERAPLLNRNAGGGKSGGGGAKGTTTSYGTSGAVATSPTS